MKKGRIRTKKMTAFWLFVVALTVASVFTFVGMANAFFKAWEDTAVVMAADDIGFKIKSDLIKGEHILLDQVKRGVHGNFSNFAYSLNDSGNATICSKGDIGTFISDPDNIYTSPLSGMVYVRIKFSKGSYWVDIAKVKSTGGLR